MADMEQQQQVIMLDASTFADHTEIVTMSQDNNVVVKEVGEDILQQAFDEASNGFEEKCIEYVTEPSIPVIDVVTDGNGTHGSVDNVSMPAENATTFAFVTSDDGNQVIQELQHEQIQNHQQPQQTTVLAEDENSNSNTGTTVLLSDNSQVLPDQLGSCVNPIRIIQQGNQYTSMQQLTSEQLTQIMQVVQQQQLAKSAEKSGGSSILFNPQTQTRIVYRVIYPSELHQKTSSTNSVVKPSYKLQSNVVKFSNETPQKRVYRKRNREEDEKYEGPELSKEEKAERKKHRPRTRSGRVSKPPKHMVKDYKRIHVLDWDEDYDDSDGGYSDIQQSDEENEERIKEKSTNEESTTTDAVLPPLKPRNHKCVTCNKGYIGRAGLGRHYKMTGHGTLEPETPDSVANRLPIEPTNGLDSQGDDSSTQGSGSLTTAPTHSHPVSFVSENFTPHTSSPVVMTTSAVTTSSLPPKPKFSVRGRKPHGHTARAALRIKEAYVNENNPLRRKQRLKELVKQCEDEELMEIVLPHLAKVITCWEFLMMKVERGRPLKPHFPDVYREFESLHRQVQKMCQEYLFVKQNQNTGGVHASEKLQISNESVARSLGLTVGTFDVREPPAVDQTSAFQYKLLTTDPTNLSGTSQTTKRTVQLVSADEMVVESKRPRISDSFITTMSVAPPMMTSADSAHGDYPTREGTGKQSERTDAGGQVDYVLHNGDINNQESQILRTETPETSNSIEQPSELMESQLVVFEPSDEASFVTKSGLNLKENTGDKSSESTTKEGPASKECDTESQLSQNPSSPTENADHSQLEKHLTEKIGVDSNQSTSIEVQMEEVTDETTASNVHESTTHPDSSDNAAVQLESITPDPRNTTDQDDNTIRVVFHDPSQQTEDHGVDKVQINEKGAVSPNKKMTDKNGILPQKETEVREMAIVMLEEHQQESLVCHAFASDHSSNVEPENPSQGQTEVVDDSQGNMVVTMSEEVVQHSDGVIEGQGAMVSVDQECLVAQGTNETPQECYVTETAADEQTQECYVTDTTGEQTQECYVTDESQCYVTEASGETAQHVLIQDADSRVLDLSEHVGAHSSIIQTPDGLLYLQNPDGTTFQLQHNEQDIPLETVQALLAMESEALVHTQQVVQDPQDQTQQ